MNEYDCVDNCRPGFRDTSHLIEVAQSPSISVLAPAPEHTTREAAVPNPSARFLRDRITGRTDPELSAQGTLRLLLGFIYPYEKARALATALLNYCGSWGAILGASEKRISDIVADSGECYALLRSVHRALALALRERIDERPFFGDLEQLQDYLRVCLANENPTHPDRDRLGAARGILSGLVLALPFWTLT